MIKSLMKFINENTTNIPIEAALEDKFGHDFDIDTFRRYIRSNKPLSKAYNGKFQSMNKAISDHAYDLMMHEYTTLSYEEAACISYCDIMSYYVTELWNKTKQIYELDSIFADDLFQTELNLIPYEVFNHLPYNTFCIDYDFEAYGVKCEGLMVDVYNYNKVVTISIIAIFNSGKKALFMNEYDLSSTTSGISGIPKSALSPEEKKIWNIVGQLCMYLSQSANDVVKSKLSKGYSKKLKAKGITKWDIGFRYGEAIKDMAKPKTESATSHRSAGSHKSHKPHIRKAHWQRYHVGKGRKETVTKWISPVLVNTDTDDDIITVIHK